MADRVGTNVYAGKPISTAVWAAATIYVIALLGAGTAGKGGQSTPVPAPGETPQPISTPELLSTESPIPATASPEPESPTPSAAVTAAPSPSYSSAGMLPPLRGSSQDLAYGLTGPPWSCETDKNSQLLTAFKRGRNAIEGLTIVLPASDDSPQVLELYTFDAANVRWHVDVANGAFEGTAGMWSTGPWTFSGSAILGGKKHPARMIVTNLDQNAFRRDFWVLDAGKWRIYSVETCSRGLPE